jgi:type I restriction enzyme R subunit
MRLVNPDREIAKHGDNLPHWQQGHVMQFVTFRLGEALPIGKIHRWKEQRAIWLFNHPKPWDQETEADYHRRFTAAIERWLDEGMGSCLFNQVSCREILADTFMRFQNQQVHHQAWVIMPNHVHLLFSPKVPISQLIQAWKSHSARTIGKGPIWQRTYRDTLIRDIDHYLNAVRYIRRNPVKAKLREDQFTLWQSDEAARI